MLALLLAGLAALPLQLEEMSDVDPAEEPKLLEALAQVLGDRVGEVVTVIDCRSATCAPRDATANTERIHVLVFGGPTRISISAERLGRGRALRASQFVPSDASDRRPLLERLARELFPNVTERSGSAEPELIPVQRAELESGRSGPRALTVVSLIVSGAALAGSLTFGLLARGDQSELSSKQVYDDEVPGLQDSAARNTTIALTLLGVGVGAGVVALIAEAVD